MRHNYSIMKNTLPILVILVLAIATVAWFASSQNNQDIAQPWDNNPVIQDGNADNTMQNPSITSQNYVEYTPAIVADSASQGKKVVLFFHASWCPTCKAAEQDILGRVNEIPENIVIVKTDYDTYTQLKEKYNITYQHTFVQVDGEGNQITVWNGGDLDEIIKNIQ